VKRKIKEVIKEDKDKEEKDSLFNDFKIKSQAAMEYLMTYGWAILIIALALGVLYSLGIMNPKNFIPRSPPGSCFVFRPNGPGTTDYVSLQGTCGYLPMYVGSFNGVNSYISIQNTPSLNPTAELTLVAWFKYASIKNTFNNGIVSKNAWYQYRLAQWRRNDPTIVFSVSINNTAYEISTSNALQVGKWYFIVGTAKSGDQQRLYVNAQLVQNRSLPNLPFSTSSSNVEIGKDVGNNYINGSIANVQIYNTALTPQEIQYLYQQGLGGGPIRLQNLVGWWPLNGDAKDYSGNNNHGTINGGVTFVQNYNPP
jgi:hypothetical protein